MPTGFLYGQIVRIRVTRYGKEKLRPVVVARSTPATITQPGLDNCR